MKITRDYPTVQITKKAKAAADTGHPWIYDAEITAPENIENGALVDVRFGERYVGTGLWSEKSKIRVRLLTRNANDRFDEAFFRRRVKYAVDYRRTVLGGDLSACRLIFGEADWFPGLTVDKFDDVLVAQTASFGMDRLKSMIFPLLAEYLAECGSPVRGVFERNDLALRELEGLPQYKGWFGGDAGATSTVITENGIKYNVDFENGQKTGYFLDQKFNRRAAASISRGLRVLDCFTHTGSFALNAASGGAERVTAVDISADAVELARANARLNGLDDKMDFVCANVFDLLPSLEAEGKKPFDFIILDPPAFTKSRKTVEGAARGYKEINYRAMKLLPRGGYLATASCSHFMDVARFREMLKSAAHDADVSLRLVEERGQSPDHPVLVNVPETDYLKFFIFQVV